jgi:hypothetical protein
MGTRHIHEFHPECIALLRDVLKPAKKLRIET